MALNASRAARSGAGRAVLITGCSSGIGLATAHMLRSDGWTVFASCRSPADCDRLVAEGFASPRIDYSDTASIETGLQEVLDATGGRLDGLFNNGAYAIPGPVEDLPTDALRAIFETNVFGWHSLTRAVIPVMRAQGAGRIVQCSSVLGFVTMPWRGAYNATKHALEGLTDTLRIELRGTAIRVVTIQPGPIRTKIRENSIPHFERWIDWRASARAEEYERALLKKLRDGTQSRFELEPEAVAVKVRTALTHPNPRPRYCVTTPTYAMAALKRILPARGLDRLLAKG